MTHREITLTRMDSVDLTVSRRIRGKVATLLIAAIGVFGLATGAQAQQFDLNQFRPAELTKDGFAVSTADDQGHLKFGLQLYVDYADDPLVFEGPGGNELLQVVHQQLTGHLTLSLGLWDRLVIYAGLPYHFIVKEDTDDDFAGAGFTQLPTGDGLGDMWLGARVRLYGEREDIFQLALQATMNVHTASLADERQNYIGGQDKSPRIGGHPEVLFTFNADTENVGVRVSGNVGYRIRDDLQFQNLNLGDELTYGLGLIIDLIDGKLGIIGEGYGRAGLSKGSSKFGTREETPIEVGGGLKYNHPDGFTAGAGAFAGVQRGYGAPDWRVFGMLGYTMPEDKGPPPSLDADGDGIADDVDQCPNDPEDIDGFQDEDGCPDPDNDADGVLDVNDGAPMDPEDPDGFEDEDGVPDPDNDGDGILDVDDQCPNEAGDAANNGCPDPDRDGDGVPDRIDNCPDEAGTPENHGCQEKQLVEIKDDKLDILEKVYFRTGSHRIRSRSFALLDNVASVITAHPEIKVIRVEGHTDSVGSERSNMRLSQRRAESVVRYLKKKGVSSDRLVAEGFGETQNLVPNTTKEERAQNRRVEFNIVADEPSTPAEDTVEE